MKKIIIPKPVVDFDKMDSEMKEFYDLLIFIGYKLSFCNNGKAWETPFKTVRDNPLPFSFHGLLFVENRNYDYVILKNDWENIIEITKHIINCNKSKSIYFPQSFDKKESWNNIIKAIRN